MVCRSKHKKAINQYKYDRVARSPLSKHCRVRVSCYDDILEGWLMGEYLFVGYGNAKLYDTLTEAVNSGARFPAKEIIAACNVLLIANYFRYYVGDNIRTDHVMYYETGLECKF